MQYRPSQHKGFQLLELIITLSIVTLLASISFPLYTQYFVKVRRTEATTALHQLALAMEKFYIEQGTYQGATLSALHVPELAAEGNYRLYIEQATSSNYMLSAQPLNQQALRDTLCSTLQLDSKGMLTVSGPGNAKTDCDS